jgi:hypothetical protein
MKQGKKRDCFPSFFNRRYMMKRNTLIYTIGILLLCTVRLFCTGNQEVSGEEVLTETDTIPVIDGIVEDNEYYVSIDTSKITVHL